ncbi:MAG: polyphosphate kinase 2 family protein [Bacteroidetes bacterium]|nr:polyphosphate kinase 2 family protein [Bacteroidota bacterium]
MIDFLKDDKIVFKKGDAFSLKKLDPEYTAGLVKEDGKELFETIHLKLHELQDKLFASRKKSLLLVFQAMDAAGKDGTIKSVMQGINPQGCQVVSFKKPTELELQHDFLWRGNLVLPSLGQIGIFNRSYYEEVLVTRVHPEFILAQNLQGYNTIESIDREFWHRRFQSINAYERHLTENGTVILKFFLHVSKEEQKKRFLERIEEPEKNWKFNYRDLEERKNWHLFQDAYEDAIQHTATDNAPWHVIPANSNWFRNLCVCSILSKTLQNMDLEYPVLSPQSKALLEKGKSELESE